MKTNILHFVFPFLVFGLIVVTFYHQNPAMRKAIIREVKYQMDGFLDQIRSYFNCANLQIIQSVINNVFVIIDGDYLNFIDHFAKFGNVL